ncbi:MAG: hypothetical protein VKI82_02270 [Leptolyngbya sp.]|nr:hypothetical protein [Leptolyngbya sp.]
MEGSHREGQSGWSLSQAQQILYNFLLDIVKYWPHEDVLIEFRNLFIHHTESSSQQAIPALQVILLTNQESDFRNTIKRCCYILVNNWEMARHYGAIQGLVDLFQDPVLQRRSHAPSLRRLRTWLQGFTASPDYEELRLFAARFAEERTINSPEIWTSRYTPYLLVPQYTNEGNPIEQRQAAKALSRRLKDKFKLDLALYTAHSQSGLPPRTTVQNPTALGESVLRLIKAIVAKRGQYTYHHLARLFLEQTKDVSYASFKTVLPKYMLFTAGGNPMIQRIQHHLQPRISALYPESNGQALDASLLLCTCNRLIDYLMTEDRQSPSPLFSLVLSQGNALTLAIMLLKVVLISRGSQIYLEVRIADLIRYYQQFPTAECQWVIHFLEVFRVAFAIYTENVEYNLVRVHERLDSSPPPSLDPLDDLSSFRIFTRKRDRGI